MICIIDYELGNKLSIKNALSKAGFESLISNSKDEIKSADSLILPGVGSFNEGMDNLKKLDLIDILEEEVLGNKKKILGICLGFQLMANESSENGNTKGLGWINNSIELLKVKDLKIPHVGWNNSKVINKSKFIEQLNADNLLYYNHSYAMRINNDEKFKIILGCEHEDSFISLGAKENIIGIQPHPEKSQLNGIKFLKNCFGGFNA
jgi:glutamine amidotransferase|tara:strand:- start:392 stop:1012 length:621 start_codon:yes stop_codon:yes gene_type:complete